MSLEILGHSEVRAAARDTEMFSSDLQGDRDVRTYRQIPLEVDPPKHHDFRTALTPLFVKPKVQAMSGQFAAHAENLIKGFIAKGGGEFISELALPMVAHCLGTLYSRPQDVDEWISWGEDAWVDESGNRSSVRLNSYLDRVFEEADNNPSQDIYSFISQIEINGKKITREEQFGIANVLLAGGRDTVIKLITGTIWHLSKSPEDLKYLRGDLSQLPRAISEVLRYLSPLPKIERIPKVIHDLPAEAHDPEQFVSISFVSGNHDERIFENPSEINIHREHNLHLSFGFGPHTCIGNHVAEIETAVFIETFMKLVPNWSMLESTSLDFEVVGTSKFVSRFHNLDLRIS
jgi:cytochrome P450